jgi:hypothetical protein
MAHLFQIQINGQYLLMTNTKHNDICPVGGAYKYYASAEELFTSLGAIDAIENIPNVDPARYRNDLRKLMPMNALLKFLSWFDTARHREWDPRRGFYSSLIAIDLLELPSFTTIQYWHYCTTRDFSKFNRDYNRYDLHHFDVFHVELSKEQEVYILDAVNQNKVVHVAGIPVRLYLVAENDLRIGYFPSLGYKVGRNAKYIICG